MSLYALLQYNDTFSRAAALSPSIWVSPEKLSGLVGDVYKRQVHAAAAHILRDQALIEADGGVEVVHAGIHGLGKTALPELFCHSFILYFMSKPSQSRLAPCQLPQGGSFSSACEKQELPHLKNGFAELRIKLALRESWQTRQGLTERVRQFLLKTAKPPQGKTLLRRCQMCIRDSGVYETPGGAILYKAINVLETITLDKESSHFKAQLAQKYADIVYNGQWFTPLREALDAFADSLEKTVTGDVKLKLYKGNMINAGVTSPYTLYDEQTASFGEDEDYNQADATGFINLFGLSIKERAKLSKNWPEVK